MILVDSSVWIDHIHKPDAMLSSLLEDNHVSSHPFVIGELALGRIATRDKILALIKKLSQSPLAEDSEVLQLIESHKLYGKGLSYIDVHLLASALISSAALWTRDKALLAAAEKLGIAPQIHYS